MTANRALGRVPKTCATNNFPLNTSWQIVLLGRSLPPLSQHFPLRPQRCNSLSASWALCPPKPRDERSSDISTSRIEPPIVTTPGDGRREVGEAAPAVQEAASPFNHRERDGLFPRPPPEGFPVLLGAFGGLPLWRPPPDLPPPRLAPPLRLPPRLLMLCSCCGLSTGIRQSPASPVAKMLEQCA